MGTIVGWRGVGVEVSGPEAAVAAVQEQLPGFFSPQTDVMASVTIDVRDGTLSLQAPDGLSCAGPAGGEGARAAASRIELLVADRLPDLAPVHAGVVAFDGRAVLLPGSSMAENRRWCAACSIGARCICPTSSPCSTRTAGCTPIRAG